MISKRTPRNSRTRNNGPAFRIEDFALVQVGPDELLRLAFDQVAIKAISEREGYSYWCGSTADGRKVAISFPWTQIDPGSILVISDPTGINTNCLLRGSDGILSQGEQGIYLFSLVQKLGWEEAVAAKLQ